MMLNKGEISHPQAINRSWFCRESFKQSQSVSCATFAVSEKKTRVFCSQSERIKCMLEWMRILTCQTYVSSVFRVFVLEATSQSFTVQSAAPDASNAPSQLKQQHDILTKIIFHKKHIIKQILQITGKCIQPCITKHHTMNSHRKK